MTLKAVMLAAGVGRRLKPPSEKNAGGKNLGAKLENIGPKALLRFGGKTLLQRHLETLSALGVHDVVIGVGHQAQAIENEIETLGARGFARTLYNPDYREGSVLTLWRLREEIACGRPVLLMDADVLYTPSILARLIASTIPNCFLLDREVGAGDEPMKICLREGRIVDFHKTPDPPWDYYGEWVGFLRLSEAMASRVIAEAGVLIGRGLREASYEDAIRAALKSAPEGFGFEDITGLPWIEIDFAHDIARAAKEILPRIETSAGPAFDCPDER
jgi:choline kinase